MAAGDVASIRGLGSGLRSDCEAGLPTETGSSGLIGAGAFDILRRKVPSARGAAWGRRKAVRTALSSCNSIPQSIEFYHVLGAIARLPMVKSYASRWEALP
jgi:hypothetical protein